MRFIVMVKANADSEQGKIPTTEELAAMGNFNEELVNAGVMLDGEGLHPSSKGARVKMTGGKPTVVDGPFAEAKELVAGYWVIQARSLEEAIEWMRRCPAPPVGEFELEIRRIYENEDFGEHLPADQAAREDRMRAELAERAQ